MTPEMLRLIRYRRRRLHVARLMRGATYQVRIMPWLARPPRGPSWGFDL